MTAAWYGHLKYRKAPLIAAILVSWLIAFFEYCLAVPANRWGSNVYSAAELKAMQEVITLAVFVVFSFVYLGQKITALQGLGFALIAASLSIATKIQVHWSGLLFGCMMFLFVAMMDLPGTLADPHNRINWVLLLRELSFGAGGWLLAAGALARKDGQGSKLITVGRIVIGIAAIFYGVEHFLHPVNVPGVPLEKFMPVWIPGPRLIAYLTGAVLLTAGVSILLARKTRTAATYLGGWILLLVIFIYGPILVVSLLDPSTDVKVEGLNYFFDTLLFAGAILALASATPPTDS